MSREKLLRCLTICLALFCFSQVAIAEEELEEGAGDSSVVKSSYLQLKPTITTNYQSSSLKYVRTDVAVRVESRMMSNIGMHKDAVRDMVIMLLARQDKDTLTSSEGISAIREEAKEEIITFLESEGEPTDVLDVLFMSFLVE